MAAFKEGLSETWGKLRHLTLPRNGAMLGGVCEAFGNATPVPAWMWRVAFCAAVLAYGTGIAVYLILLICIPDEPKKAV